jgi:bacterioferritin-associated ferredoxin
MALGPLTEPLVKAIFSSEMFLCLCRGVTDRTVQKIIDEGATTVAEVGARCGAGTDCGSCHEAIEERLELSLGNGSDSQPICMRSLLDCPGAPSEVASGSVEEKAA